MPPQPQATDVPHLKVRNFSSAFLRIAGDGDSAGELLEPCKNEIFAEKHAEQTHPEVACHSGHESFPLARASDKRLIIRPSRMPSAPHVYEIKRRWLSTSNRSRSRLLRPVRDSSAGGYQHLLVYLTVRDATSPLRCNRVG